VVDIPAGSVGPAVPTGIVFNGSYDFKVSQGGVNGARPFIFVGVTGTVARLVADGEHDERDPGLRRRREPRFLHRRHARSQGAANFL